MLIQISRKKVEVAWPHKYSLLWPSVGERSVKCYVYETRKERARSGILEVTEGRRYRKKHQFILYNTLPEKEKVKKREPLLHN